MLVKTVVFNEAFSEKWQETPFLPAPTLRNMKMVINYLLARMSLVLLPTVAPNYPQYAVIDPSSACNLRCPLCPTGIGDMSRSHVFLSFDDYKRIIGQLGDYLTSIYFTNWGEPFLNPDFLKIAEYSKKAMHIPFISTSTNLNVEFSDDDLSRLINSGLDMINVSADGATQETYEKYRRGGKLQVVIDNSKRILAKRKELGKDKPFVVWNFFVFRHNLHEIESIERLAKDVGVDALRISAPHVYLGVMDKPFDQLYEMSKDYLLPPSDEYSAYLDDGTKKEMKRKCNWLWRGVAIGSDGSVTPCCNIYPSKYNFGNSLKSGFKNIWNNKMYRDARKSVKGKECPMDNICAKCTELGNWI